MDIRKLQRTIVDGLEDVKGQNIVVFNTEHLSSLFERVIIASGTSNRQTKALASSVRESVKAKGFTVMRTEGEDNGEWIIVDCGAAVVHVMQPSIREYYHLEEIWGDKPVKMKVETGPVRLVKASEDEAPAPARKKAAAKTAPAKAGKADTGKTAPAKAAGKATAKPAAKSAGKAPAVKTAATKTTRRAAPVAEVAPAPARKTVARKMAPTTVTKLVVGQASKAAGKTTRKAPAKSPAKAGAVTRTVGVKGGAGKTTVSAAVPAPAARKAPARKAAAKTSRKPAA